MGRETEGLLSLNEETILEDYAASGRGLDTSVASVERASASYSNPASEDTVGGYRPSKARHALLTDVPLLERIRKAKKSVPCFPEAGPRRHLMFDPANVRAAIVTTGGIAPGLNSVVHAIVQRHYRVYGLNPSSGGVWGIRDGFRGFRQAQEFVRLEPEFTEPWIQLGGSELGAVRYYGDDQKSKTPEARSELARTAARCLENRGIDILYVLGGDGSMRVAHEIAREAPQRAVVCVPKTMDNDILWVSESFGFATAVDEASRVINTLHGEARSTRRICVVELFGAESGFVAAHAALASNRVDLVLVPEVFAELAGEKRVPGACEAYWRACLRHLDARLKKGERAPHAVIVVAQGVGAVLSDAEMRLGRKRVPREGVAAFLEGRLKDRFKTSDGDEVGVFSNEPRHNIRAVVANAHDQLYCGRLGAMAVDCALAGYTDCMVSQWMAGYVMVPLPLATEQRKAIALDRMLWAQVLGSTGQPSHRMNLAAPVKVPVVAEAARVGDAAGQADGRTGR